MSRVVALVPALDEEDCIAAVVEGIAPYVERVVVIDNGSTDRTRDVAEAAGAEVVSEPRRGYGRACLTGLEHATAMGASIVLFLDGDGSDRPADAPSLVDPVVSGAFDIVLGARTAELIEPGAMTPVQRFGNWFAPLLMRLALGASYGDMPPFKACSLDALRRLDLRDEGHGFTIELLVKAHREGLRVLEVPVHCRVRRAGQSKVSGTVRGASRAAIKILATVGRHAVATKLGDVVARSRPRGRLTRLQARSLPNRCAGAATRFRLADRNQGTVDGTLVRLTEGAQIDSGFLRLLARSKLVGFHHDADAFLAVLGDRLGEHVEAHAE
jgi:glycosyltransferase involved in cell wall biosynthesis